MSRTDASHAAVGEQHLPRAAAQDKKQLGGQAPISPPSSGAASQFDAQSSPPPSAFTPPASVAMSAEHSQNSLASATPLVSPPAVPVQDMTMAEGRSSVGTKRKASVDDTVHRPTKQLRTESEDISTRQLPLNVDSTVSSLVQPHPEQDLISMYSLESLARTVARRDPATGDKINKLRKSYENHIKDLPGRNKATNVMGELMNVLQYPDEEWHIQQEMGKDLMQDFSKQMMGKLQRAVKMDPGPLPSEESKHWRTLLRLDETSKSSGGFNTINTASASTAPKSAPVSANPTAPSPTGSITSRPSRRGTKRRYDDDSFEGYTESFANEYGDEGSPLDDDEDGRSTGGSMRKRRRKDVGSSGPFSPSLSQYGPNSVSIAGNGR